MQEPSPWPAQPQQPERRRWRLGAKLLVGMWIVLGLLWLLLFVSIATATDLGTLCVVIILATFLTYITIFAAIPTVAYAIYRIVRWASERRTRPPPSSSPPP